MVRKRFPGFASTTFRHLDHLQRIELLELSNSVGSWSSPHWSDAITNTSTISLSDFYTKPRHLIPVVKPGESNMPEGVVAEDIARDPEEIEVTPQHTEVQSKIGDKVFCEKISKIFSEGKSCWRTPQALAKMLEVDAAELADWMDKQQELCCRPSKEDGTYFYAHIQRLEKAKDEKKGMPRPLISEEDRYAFSQLHLIYKNFSEVMDKYAMRVHEKNKDAFDMFAAAKEKMSSAMGALANTLKVDVHKLLDL